MSSPDSPKGSYDVLDLLFDGRDGLLRNNNKFNTNQSKVHTINMEDLDYLSCDFLDDILQFPVDSIDNKSIVSPGNSDSGLSMDGVEDSPLLPDINNTHDHCYTLSNQNTCVFLDQSDFSCDIKADESLQTIDFDIDDSLVYVFDGTEVNKLDGNISIDVGMPDIYDTVTTVRLKELDTLPVTLNDISLSYTTAIQSYDQLPELRLSDEEKILMAKEGFLLPTHMPLTKEEERQLKAVRRKIRNKISAKESRKRKMSYVEGLEKRVKVSTVENAQLRRKVTALEQQNISLVEKLRRLQTMFGSTTNKSAQASTCVMVLALSFMFILIPTYSPLSYLWSPGQVAMNSPIITPGNSRSLLQNKDMLVQHDLDSLGVTPWPRPPWGDPQQSATNVLYNAVDSDDDSGKRELMENVARAINDLHAVINNIDGGVRSEKARRNDRSIVQMDADIRRENRTIGQREYSDESGLELSADAREVSEAVVTKRVDRTDEIREL